MGTTPVAKVCPVWQLLQLLTMPVWTMVHVLNPPGTVVLVWQIEQSSAVVTWVAGFATGTTPVA
jgi:hypothetical protein